MPCVCPTRKRLATESQIPRPWNDHHCQLQSQPPNPAKIARPPGCLAWYSVTSSTMLSTTMPVIPVNLRSSGSEGRCCQSIPTEPILDSTLVHFAIVFLYICCCDEWQSLVWHACGLKGQRFRGGRLLAGLFFIRVVCIIAERETYAENVLYVLGVICRFRC